MRKPKQDYDARWEGPTLAALANGTIRTTCLSNALRSARSLAKKWGYTSTLFTIHLNGRLQHHGL